MDITDEPVKQTPSKQSSSANGKFSAVTALGVNSTKPNPSYPNMFRSMSPVDLVLLISVSLQELSDASSYLSDSSQELDLSNTFHSLSLLCDMAHQGLSESP